MSSELYQYRDEARYVADLMSHKGWAVLEKAIKLEAKTLREKFKSIDDPIKVFACVRKVDGLESILEIAESIMQRGADAHSELEARGDA